MTVIGPAAAAEDPQVRQACRKGCVQIAKLLRIAVIQHLRRIQLRVA